MLAKALQQSHVWHTVQVEAYFNDFMQLEESELYRDTEVLESGNIDAWTAAEPGAHFLPSARTC